MLPAASTLAALIVLGGMSVAEAQDASAGGSLGGGLNGLLVGALPKLPENWADLPFQIHLSEEVGYNDNILSSPNNASFVVNNASVVVKPIGAFESISNFGASTKFNWGYQQVFADASFGMYRYLNHSNFDTTHHNIDAGMNWTYTSKCAGRLVFSDVSEQSLPTQQIGVNLINSMTTASFDETGRCAITGNYSAVLNSGISYTTNSTALNALNNARTIFIAAGVNYAVASTNSLELLATLTGTEYPNRTLTLNALGINRDVLEDEINLTYTKDFSPDLAVIASIGVIASENKSFRFDFPTGFLPIYSLSFDWSATPRIKVRGSVARVVSPPTTTLANLQVNENVSIGLSYLWTPKLTLSGVASTGYSTSSFNGQSVAALPSLGISQSSHTYSASATLVYAVSPFLRTSLSYQFSRSAYPTYATNQNLFLLGLNFNPY